MSQLQRWILVSAALSAAGCGGTKMVPTRGVVTFNGKPLVNANVIFTSQEPDGKPATGVTDADGMFELTTLAQKDGALPGLYKVTVHASETIEIPPGLKTPDAIQQAMSSTPRKASVILPEVYSRQDQTPLQHRVPEDGDAKLELQSNPPAAARVQP